MSLRSRVALLVLTLFLVGILAALARAIQDAQRDIHEQIDATRAFTVQLLSMANASVRPYSEELSPVLLQRLKMLEADGFLSIEILAANVPATPAPPLTIAGVPAWFIKLLDIDTDNLRQVAGSYAGQTVFVRIDPGGLVLKNWDTVRNAVMTRLGPLLLFSILIYLLLGRWLKPIDQIVEGLQEIEKGDFSKRIAQTGLQELDQISGNINHLTEVLGASQADNIRLQSEAISRGEQERLRLARELHDSLGQSITAIKAVSVSIGMRARDSAPDIADSAQHIERISEGAYATVRSMMSSLRPQVLDELGLISAVQQMVDDWNIHHESTFCRLRLDPSLVGLDGEQTINIYRIVQESLNNIVKYAQATEVDIQMSGGEVLTLTIADNGIGFDPLTVKKGMGLWNIQDRVNLLHGKFQLLTSPGNGVRLFMELPRHLPQRKRNL